MKKRSNKIMEEILNVEPIESFDYNEILQDKQGTKKRIEEKERISNIKCPVCKSTNKKHIVRSENNGVFGPGYSSWIVDDYFVCQNCGVMFKDIKK